MKCPRCDLNLDEGVLFCPACGQEIQWVPNYNTLEIWMQEQERKNSETEKEQPPAAQMEGRKKKKKTWIVPVVVLGGAVIALMIAMTVINKMNYNSFDYQLGQAEASFSNKNYNEAMEYAERALSLESQSVQTRLLVAEIYTASGKREEAVSILLEALEAQPDNANAYGQLLRLYEADEDNDAIKSLMDKCEIESIRKKYQEYICEEPVIELEAGSYTKKEQVKVSANASDTVYYTADGTTPTTQSQVYVSPVTLEEGETRLQALAINAKGIQSDVVSAVYKVVLKPPVTPQITPASGEYVSGAKIVVENIPSGCVAFYAFDETPDASAKKYEGEIEMPEGEHIFSVIFIDRNRKSSNVASETYAVYQ